MAVVQLKAERLGPVAEIRSYLEVVEQAYNELYAFHLIVSEAKERAQPDKGSWRYSGRQRRISIRRITRAEAVVLPEDRLRLRSVQIQSPGSWDFIGSLNPLETLRKYIQDRHERRKDREYRERLESERMELENQKLKTDVVKEQVGLLRNLGVPEETIRQSLTAHVIKPLERLDRYQDRGLVDGAVMIPEAPSSDDNGVI